MQRKLSLLLAIFLLLSSLAWGTTYCVDATGGSDGAAGTATGALCTGTVSAWKTLSKVNATVANSDVVLFKRGEIWREQFTNNKNVSYGAYGSGNKPSIRGSVTDNTGGSWTNESGGGTITNAVPAVNGDDGYWDTSTTFHTDQNDLVVGNQSGTGGVHTHVFSRFPALAIPAGATITAATITYQANNTNGTSGVTANVKAYAEDNATAPTSEADAVGRAETTASVAWSVPTTWTAGTDYSPNDISAVIQEVVNRGGWTSGNAIVLQTDITASATFTFKNAKAHNVSTTLCPRLNITYTSGAGNLWYLSSIAADPGIFAHDGTLGARKTSKGTLTTQWDYWYDSGNTRLYAYSVGNPTSSAALLEHASLQYISNEFCHSSTYDNLDFRHYRDITYLQFGCATASVFTNDDFSQLATLGLQFNDNSGSGMTASISGCTFTDWGVVTGAEQMAIMGISGAGPIDVTNSTGTINHSNTTQLYFVDADLDSWFRTVSGNVVTNNGTKSIIAYGIYRAPAVANGNAITVTNNKCVNTGMCVDMNGVDDGAATPTVEVSYNYAQNSGIGDLSDQHAIRCYGTNTSTVPMVFKYNIIDGAASGANAHAGFALDACVGQKFYGNTIVGVDDGILIKNSSTGNDMRNNISAFNRLFGIHLTSGTVTTFTNNLFNTNSSGNYSGISAGTGDVTGDPLFTNRAGHNLTIASSSPAIDVGANLGSTYQLGLGSTSVWPSAVVTANQNSFGAGWDIGAFVFPSASSTHKCVMGQALCNPGTQSIGVPGIQNP